MSRFSLRHLETLAPSFIAAKIFWSLHALSLLGHQPSHELSMQLTSVVAMCQHPRGGFGSDPGAHLPQLAATYSAVVALVTIGTDEALQLINRTALLAFLMRVKRPDGAFAMWEGGDISIRGAYCALAVADLCNIQTPELAHAVAEHIATCQTYEGGFGAVPDAEAHVFYSYCAFASLVILGKTHLINVSQLASSVRRLQCEKSSGFRGRTNKLVHSCYAFWAGALLTLLQEPYDYEALQRFVVVCCLDPAGGVRSKPGRYAHETLV